LRQAIQSSNTTPGTNQINFQISGTPPFSIAPHTALPSLGVPVVIDGTTQPGFVNAPVIELNGASAGANVAGLTLLSGFSTVRGLAINRFLAQGMVLNGPSNVIQGNYFGTDVTGTLSRANTSYGIWVESSGNLIGGTNAGNGNVLSGGNNTGIFILNGNSNVIQGNLIGVAAAGTAPLGNVDNGVTISGGQGNVIGGLSAGAQNVISGNGQSGIYLNGATSTGNSIQGNLVGLGLSGGSIVANINDGITINGAPGNTISGGNIISGNEYSGISINSSGAVTNVIWGNFIGTDITGKIALGNANSGVTISAASGNQIGGTNAGYGNVISGNAQNGVYLTGGAVGNFIQGNYIGVSTGGTNGVGNLFDGILMSGATSNLIGGTVAGARNVISGNTDNGVGIALVSDRLNTVSGNYIGTDVTGQKSIANQMSGVLVQGCSNIIGGPLAGSGNVISANRIVGIYLLGTAGNVTGNLVQGNIIGLNAAGSSALGNFIGGIEVASAANNQIGGTTAGARNVISENGNSLSGLGGVFFYGAGTTGNQLLGNYIGSDISGTLRLGNFNDGVYLMGVATNYIGSVGGGNLISANGVDGVYLTNATWNLIQGNFIGTKADGTNALGNTYHNVELDINANNNTIGGVTAGAGNHIAFAQTSLRSGVRVRPGSLNNLISGNSIFNNAYLGIDLGAAGINPNVPCETGQSGAANAGQNYPVLTSVYGGTMTLINGSLNSGAGKTYTLQFFASPSGNALGFGEGKVYLGQASLALVACSNNFAVVLPVSVPSGWVVTATATDPANNTSEFSEWLPVGMTLPSIRFSAVNPANGQFSLSWTNDGGNYTLQYMLSLNPPIQWINVTNTPSLANGLFVVAQPMTNGAAFYRLEAQ
jgi:titin